MAGLLLQTKELPGKGDAGQLLGAEEEEVERLYAVPFNLFAAILIWDAIGVPRQTKGVPFYQHLGQHCSYALWAAVWQCKVSGQRLRSFERRRKHKVDPDGLQFLQDFFNAIGHVAEDLQIVLPSAFRISTASGRVLGFMRASGLQSLTSSLLRLIVATRTWGGRGAVVPR